MHDAKFAVDCNDHPTLSPTSMTAALGIFASVIAAQRPVRCRGETGSRRPTTKMTLLTVRPEGANYE